MKFPAFEPIDLKNKVGILEIIEIELSQIIPDPNQPRKNFDKQLLNDLASSITQHGVIQPIIVTKLSDDKYQIIAGERRWRASEIAGKNVIPAIIQGNNEQQNLAISLIENIQRENLNPIELAEFFYRLNVEYALSHEEIALMIGKSRSTISNLLRLLDLPTSIRKQLFDGKLEMGHARAILASPLEHQEKLANIIIEQSLTVRDVERIAQGYKVFKEDHNIYVNEVNEWKKKLSKVLPFKFDLKINRKGEGKMRIHFKTLDEIKWLLEQLSVTENEC